MAGLMVKVSSPSAARRARSSVLRRLATSSRSGDPTPSTLEELGQQFLEPNPGVKLEVSGELRFDNGR